MKQSIFFIFVLFLGQTTLAQQIFTSGPKRVTLLELFTSQGCSSCPPAERWLDRHVDEDTLWTDVVPVVWHVDYWDYLGWTDPFAKEAYSIRQRNYRYTGAVRSVYTPCFVANGNEWRGFFTRQPLPEGAGTAPELRAELKDGVVSVTLSSTDDEHALHVAVLESGLTTDVSQGENRGRSLEQNFVVIDHEALHEEDGSWTFKLPEWNQKKGARYALALWVTRSGEQDVVQAAGGWLTK